MEVFPIQRVRLLHNFMKPKWNEQPPSLARDMNIMALPKFAIIYLDVKNFLLWLSLRVVS